MIENIIYEMNNLQIIIEPLFYTAAATALIEAIFWYFAGFRSIKFEILIVILNIISNLSLNIAFLYIPQKNLNILISEIFVILFEFIVIKAFFKRYCWQTLLKFTFFANLTSYFLGFLYFSIFK